MTIRINGGGSVAVVPYGQTVTLTLADLTLTQTLAWEILPPLDSGGSSTDPINWSGWTVESDGRLTKNGTSVSGVPDVADGWMLSATETQTGNTTPIIHTGVFRVNEPTLLVSGPAAAENAEAGSRGWWQVEKKYKEALEKGASGFVVYNDSGVSLSGFVYLSGAVDFRAVGGNATPAGATTKPKQIPKISAFNALVSGALDKVFGYAPNEIPNGSFGWVYLRGTYVANLSGIANGGVVYLGDAGGFSAVPGTTEIKIGVALTGGASGVLQLRVSGSGGGSTSGAPADAQYWTGAANGTLSAEHNLGALTTGLVKNTAGVPSIAVAGTDYLAGSALSIAAGQVAYATGANTLGGNAGLTWDNAAQRLQAGGVRLAPFTGRVGGGGAIQVLGSEASPNVGRIVIGDGTGWNLGLAAVSAGLVTTDVYKFDDRGRLDVVGTIGYQQRWNNAAGVGGLYAMGLGVNGYLSTDSYYGGSWVAGSTSNAQLYQQGSASHVWYANTGLTPGAGFVPKLTMQLLENGEAYLYGAPTTTLRLQATAGLIQHINNGEANVRWRVMRDMFGAGLAGVAFGPGGATTLDAGGCGVGYAGSLGRLGFWASNGTSLLKVAECYAANTTEGVLDMKPATSRVVFGTGTATAPTAVGGWKIALYGTPSASGYGIGVEGGHVWYHAGITGHKFYTAETLQASVTGAGVLTLVSGTSSITATPASGDVRNVHNGEANPRWAIAREAFGVGVAGLLVGPGGASTLAAAGAGVGYGGAAGQLGFYASNGTTLPIVAKMFVSSSINTLQMQGSNTIVDFGGGTNGLPEASANNWKLALWGLSSGVANAYGLGIEGGAIWYHSPALGGHKFYSGDKVRLNIRPNASTDVQVLDPDGSVLSLSPYYVHSTLNAELQPRYEIGSSLYGTNLSGVRFGPGGGTGPDVTIGRPAANQFGIKLGGTERHVFTANSLIVKQSSNGAVGLELRTPDTAYANHWINFRRGDVSDMARIKVDRNDDGEGSFSTSMIFSIRKEDNVVDDGVFTDLVRLSGWDQLYGVGLLPGADNSVDLGNAGYRWKLVRGVTITSGDLVLGGNDAEYPGEIVLREGPDGVYMYNARTGRKSKIIDVEVSDEQFPPAPGGLQGNGNYPQIGS